MLSACDTAGPSAKTGESLSGLARAFFRAGARGVMVTHWSIAPGAAVPLMVNTFPTAAPASDTAQALRQAQLQMIDSAGNANNPIELSYPNYWAAFGLIGDGVRARTQGARQGAGSCDARTSSIRSALSFAGSLERRGYRLSDITHCAISSVTGTRQFLRLLAKLFE